MRTAYALTLAATLAGSAVLATPAGAAEVCDKTCVGPACAKDCVREPDVTVGRDRRDKEITIDERTGMVNQIQPPSLPLLPFSLPPRPPPSSSLPPPPLSPPPPPP